MTRHIMMNGYFQSEEFFANITSEIRDEFTAVKLSSDRVKELRAEINAKPSIAVHIRRGDYSASRAHFTLPGHYYNEAIRNLETETNPLRLFFFSDDPEWVNSQPFAKKGTVVSDGVLSAIEEFAIMRSCDHFVIANSTFSWWAAWLGSNPAKRVIAPSNWHTYQSGGSPKIIPRAWRTI